VRNIPSSFALIAILSLAAARTGRAATIPLERSVQVTPGRTCLEEERLEEHVRAWLHRTRVDAGVRVVVQGDAVRPDAAAFRILRDGVWRVRRFDALPAGCEEAHAAMGLAIALAIDQTVLEQIASLAPPRGRKTLLAAQLGFGYEVLPSVSLGGRLGAEHAFLDWLDAGAELGAHYSRRNSVSGTPGTFDATLFSLSLRACMGHSISAGLKLALCTGASGGLVHAVGARYTTSASSSGEWGGAFTGLRIDVTAGIHWILDAELVVPLWSPSFRVTQAGGDAVREPKLAGLLLNLGPGLAF
jgi:hypothetical protein